MTDSWKWGQANGRIDVGLRVFSLGRKGIDNIGVGGKSTVCVTSMCIYN